MNKYQITYDRCGNARVFNCRAESEGEALEAFDELIDRCDDYCEFVSIVEVK